MFHYRQVGGLLILRFMELANLFRPREGIGWGYFVLFPYLRLQCCLYFVESLYRVGRTHNYSESTVISQFLICLYFR